MKKWLFALTLFILVVLNVAFIEYSNDNSRLIEELEHNHDHVSYQKLFDNTWAEIKDNYYDASLNRQIWYRWKEHYRGKIKTEADAKVAIDSMLASLNDPYSKYMDKEEYSEQNSSIASKIVGIGVNIASVSGKITIINVMDGSPAQSANLQANDIIYAVDGKEISGMPIAEVANLVKGKENSVVDVTILRNNEKLNKKIVRKEIKIKTVKSTIDKNIGYIQISTFVSVTTPNDFLEALEKTQNTDGLIIDLRGNTGGLLPNAVFIANLFIPEGNIVSIVGRDGYKFDIAAQNLDLKINKPLVILVDGNSASASEILSGALKDYKKAVLLGTKTYGKGMVQKIIPLQNDTGLNLTIAKYLTPKGSDINQKGIEPDYKVEFTINDLKNQNDVQLATAKNIINNMISHK
ncbi:MAG: S41 family peptidase [Fusobacterium sp.]|nr:S41 family peptidase [Fusobacterium sp.]